MTARTFDGLLNESDQQTTGERAMTARTFDELLSECDQQVLVENFRPHVGVVYRLYFVDGNEHILWCGSGRYARTAWLPTVWLPVHAIKSVLLGVIESRYFASRETSWQVVDNVVTWDAPVWLEHDLEPASEQELLAFARGSWQRACVRWNVITFSKLRGRAAYYGLSYRCSMENLLNRIRAAGYVVVPVYGPKNGAPKRWEVYRP